jgi:predicted MFS family arabinose efflux permease
MRSLARLVPALAPSRMLDFSPAVRSALRVDVSVMLLLTLFTGLTTPFTGLILRRELGASALQLSVLASAGAACLLLSLGLTRLIDSHRPLPWVVWPGFLARGLFLLVPFIHTAWPFVGVLVAGTLLGTIAGPAQTALVEQLYPRSERGRALGTVRVIGALAAIVLALGAGYVLGRFGHRWPFAAAGVAGMAAALWQRRLPLPSAAAGRASARPRLAEAWRVVREDRRYRRVLLASSIFGTGIWLMMPANPILLADVMQATPGHVGVLAAAAAVAALVGNVVWGRLVDRRSSVPALRMVYTLGTLTPLVYFVISLFPRTPWALLAGSVSESLMHTGLDLVWMLTVIELGGAQRTTQYAAIGATLAGVRGIAGPLLSALVIETLGLRAVYLMAAALMGCGAWMVAHAQKTPRYIEQPAHTSGGVGLASPARSAS